MNNFTTVSIPTVSPWELREKIDKACRRFFGEELKAHFTFTLAVTKNGYECIVRYVRAGSLVGTLAQERSIKFAVNGDIIDMSAGNLSNFSKILQFIKEAE